MLIHTETQMTGTRNPVAGVLAAAGAGVSTPDSDRELASPWTDTEFITESDYSQELFANTPWCAKGDDLDDDEAYFLDDDEDEDDEDDDDYDDEDDDDFDDDEDDADSLDDEDDEEL